MKKQGAARGDDYPSVSFTDTSPHKGRRGEGPYFVTLSQDPVKRLLRIYRAVAVWGALLLLATLIQNVPLWNGRLWLLPLIPPIAGVRRSRVCGLFVGIAAGFLHDWTAEGWFGAAGVLFGLVGFLCGR